MQPRSAPGLLAALLLLAVAAPARAGGLEIPEHGTRAVARGGAFTVLADNPTAIALNPGALSRLTGTSLYLSNTFWFAPVTFTRAESGIPQTYKGNPEAGPLPDPLAPVEKENPWFALGPFIAAASDFGLEDWTFAFGVYGPSAVGNDRYPTQGGNRYMMTEKDVRLVYVSAAVAYGDADRFGVGVTLQYAIADRLRLKLVADGSLSGGLNPYYGQNDVIANVEMHDYAAFSAIVGGWWRPVPALEVALSGRVIPVKLGFEGDWTLSNVPGQTQFPKDRLEVTDSSAAMDLTLPPTARAGIRYRHLVDGAELFDVELDVVYEAWSMLERYNVDLEGQINLFAPSPAPDAIIEKRWRDTVSVRLGGTWNAIRDRLGVSAGAWYESGATPENYEHLDFPSFDRIGFGLGLEGRIGPVRLGFAYGHIFQETRESEEAYAKVFQVRPIDPCPDQCDFGAGWSGVPVNGGRYESSYDQLSASVQVDF